MLPVALAGGVPIRIRLPVALARLPDRATLGAALVALLPVAFPHARSLSRGFRLIGVF